VPEVTGFFDKRTSTLSYVVACPETGKAAVIDPLLDYEPRAGRTDAAPVERIAAFVKERGLAVEWLLDTHPHADHLSGIALLKDRLGAPTGIGRGLIEVQKTWKEIYNLGEAVPADGSQYDRLFDEGDSFTVGKLEGRVLHTPGHTPACCSYLIGDAVFVGDLIFMPDFGTARADFPGGCARQLYRSIHKVLALPPETRLFTCHDYQPGGRELAFESTVAEQKAGNKHVRDGIAEAEFVALRRARDCELELPELLLAALQVNIRGGRLPEPEGKGGAFLKIPLNRF
jgi:glyoxylase-like metal-dependent hydrolase (beta-lactamase superfamily II)